MFGALSLCDETLANSFTEIAELKDSLTRIGYDLKQRIIDSVKNTWRSLNNFALSHKMAQPPQDEVEREVDTVLSEMTKDVDDSGSGR